MEPMAEKKVEKAEVESRKQVKNLEPNLFDGAPRNSKALTIERGAGTLREADVWADAKLPGLQI